MEFLDDYSNIKTGDILVFSGTENTSIFIKLGTQCVYNHIGIALWLKTNENYSVLSENEGDIKIEEFHDNSDGSDLFIFESSEGISYDILTQKTKFGCRIVRLKDTIKFYDKIAVRKLNIQKSDFFYNTLNNFINEYKDIDYDRSPFNLMLAPLGLSVGSSEKNTFCSELAAEYMYRLELFPDSQKILYPPKQFLPKDFVIKNKKVPQDAFDGDIEVIYDRPSQNIKTYGIFIILFLVLIFALIIKYSK